MKTTDGLRVPRLLAPIMKFLLLAMLVPNHLCQLITWLLSDSCFHLNSICTKFTGRLTFTEKLGEGRQGKDSCNP